MIKKIYSWFHAKTSRQDERGEYSSGLWQDLVRQQAIDWCSQIPGRILEVGCGEGLFLGQLNKRNPVLELWGLDNSLARIERAERRLAGAKMHWEVGDATQLVYVDNFFSSTVCINVFFNMPSADIVRKALLEMKRVTCKGGEIIFDFRNGANPLLALKYKFAPWYDRTVKDLPLKTYSLSFMENLLKESGLEIIEKKFIGNAIFFPPAIIIIRARKI